MSVCVRCGTPSAQAGNSSPSGVELREPRAGQQYLEKALEPLVEKIDGVSPLEYSLEFVQQQPLEALKGIPQALARAAKGYLLWYERSAPHATYEHIS